MHRKKRKSSVCTSFDCVKLVEFSVSSSNIASGPMSVGSFGVSAIPISVPSMIYKSETYIEIKL